MQDRVRPEIHLGVFQMNLQEMKHEQKAALNAAEAIITAAESHGGNMTTAE